MPKNKSGWKLWFRDAARDIEFEYKDRTPEYGFEVEVDDGEVEIAAWFVTDPPDDPEEYEDWEKRPVLKSSTVADLADVVDPASEHNKIVFGAPVPGDPMEILRMPESQRRHVIVSAAYRWLQHYGGSEEWVEAIGD